MSERLCPRCNASNRASASFCAGCGTPLLEGSEKITEKGAMVGGGSFQDRNNTLSVGMVVEGRYRIEEELGHGGFGAVYRAWDDRLSKWVAIKENLDVSQDVQRQFAREATVLANLSHLNLPRVSDHFVVPEAGQYLVMDYVEGEDLLTLLESKKDISIQQAVEWMIQVADALEYLHSQQPPVVHRDVKPSNIRITAKGKAVLVDFGLVKFSDPYKKITSGARAITPGYAPPEQYGTGKTDVRSDIYALGATMYRVITGIDPPESVQRLAGVKLLPPNQIVPGLSMQLNHIIDRAMALEPAKRYQDAAALMGALWEYLSDIKNPNGVKETTQVHDVSPAVFAHPSASLVRPAGAVPITPPEIQAYRRDRAFPRKFSLWLGIGLGSISVIICGALMVALLFGRDHEVTPTAKASSTLLINTTPSSEQTATPSSTSSIARDTATSSAEENTTSTAQSQASATEQARESFLATINANKILTFGPKSGRILQREEDGTVKTMSAGAGLRNFVAEVKFFNPFPTSLNPWDYGFMFRYANGNQHFRLIILSDRSWAFINYGGKPEGIVLVEGSISNLVISEGDSNLIRLIAREDRGWFYVNGEFISELDLSSQYSGGIMIATGMKEGDEVTGKLTEYQDFTVWSLP